MVVMPAWCPKCNMMVEQSGGIVVEGDSSVTIVNSSVNCPRCGGRARFIEGTFNIRDEIIEVVAASVWTRTKLAEFQSALRWAAANYAEQPELAIGGIEKVNPAFGALLRRASDPNTILTLLGILIALAAWLYPRTPDESTPVNVPTTQINQFFMQSPDVREKCERVVLPPKPAPPQAGQRGPEPPAAPPLPPTTESPP